MGNQPIDIRALALLLLRQNPNVANNPNAQEMIAAIQNNDAQKGEQIAQNLLNTYGVDRETGIRQARQFFGI